MNKFTPGPWKTSKDGHGCWQIDAEDGSAWIAKTTPMRSLITGLALLDTEADARLIAAAPELLDCLDGLVETLLLLSRDKHGEQMNRIESRSRSMVLVTDCIATAQAAIVKATGCLA